MNLRIFLTTVVTGQGPDSSYEHVALRKELGYDFLTMELRFKLVDSRFGPGLLAKAEFSQCVRLLIAPEWIPESLQHRPTCLQTHLKAKPRANNDTCVPIHVRVSACSD